MSRTSIALPALLTLLALLGCATLDGGADRLTAHPPDEATASSTSAHGPAVRGPDGWVVSVTPEELAALGLGQQMELDIQAPGVVYIVDYQRLGQLDNVFARTAFGLLPLRALLEKHYAAGRVVLRTAPDAQPASQPAVETSGDCDA